MIFKTVVIRIEISSSDFDDINEATLDRVDDAIDDIDYASIIHQTITDRTPLFEAQAKSFKVDVKG